MIEFWEIIKSWESPIGQAIFLLLVIGAILAAVKHSVYYLTVMFRGWPPEGHEPPDTDDL